ncbi:hypothetical protein JTE90_004279 [Oedothorax gibbosus]|uniref:GATA-type domain-containing protein n=1 Tax=Oedothorax gibbosus TaxID=931172 RepID=A0AAV6VN80_9ARAC|nr:hypothetical protein JTE90_004279 [Oedothorax gibbosus]
MNLKKLKDTRSPLTHLTTFSMEFPIRFPAQFLNTSPLPYLRTGPSPYIGPYPTSYINFNPYIVTNPAPLLANISPLPCSSNDAVAGSDTSDLAMDTSGELFIHEDSSSENQDPNDSGISCTDSESGTEKSPSEVLKVRGCRKRKSFEPSRTLPLDDPKFRGVTVTMENRLVNKEWMFVMHSSMSLPPRKKRKFRAYVDSSDEEDCNNNITPITEEKHCASCSVKKTPLWRDAEDGTPLCNACGIRYKKYKLRCGTCWHIPKKDEFRPTCQYCGSFYEYIYPRR